jgi:flavodoxin
MKRLITLMAALVLLVPAYAQKKNDTPKMKTLVAYFSATGTTKAIAEKLAKVTGATLYEIRPEVPYTDADLNWRNRKSRSSVEMADPDSRPAFVKDLADAGSYDVIYIGFPVWWYTAPTIINTFLDTYDFSGKTVVFFATSGGSGLKKANAQFRKQYPSLNWKDGTTLNRASEKDIQKWVESL